MLAYYCMNNANFEILKYYTITIRCIYVRSKADAMASLSLRTAPKTKNKEN